MNNPNYRREMERATREFFGVESIDEFEKLKIHEQEMSYFNEWLVFDFALENGLNLLKDFCHHNPLKLSPTELKVYWDLQNNESGFWETKKIDLDSGLEIVNVQNKNKYYVNEISGTYQLVVGDIFYGRVGQIQDHRELVGADSFILRANQSKTAAKKFWNSMSRLPITPKHINDLLGPRARKTTAHMDQERKSWESILDINLDSQTTEKNLEKVLSKYGLAKFTDTNRIKKWISFFSDRPDDKMDGNEMAYLTMIAGLMIDLREDEAFEVIRALNNFYNSLPQKSLGGKSPDQMTSADKEPTGLKKARLWPGLESDPRFQEKKLNVWSWHDAAEKALLYTANNKIEKALKEYNRAFQLLLKERTTYPDVYRLFANKATMHLALGEEHEGRKFLDIALSLNSNYDFAQSVLKKLNGGEYDEQIQNATLRKALETLQDKNHPFNKWNLEEIKYQWPLEKILDQLAKFGIKTNREDFKKKSEGLFSAEELAKRFFYASYRGPEEDEDFVWMAAYGLWARWQPEHWETSTVSDIIEEIFDLAPDADKQSQKVAKKIELLLHYTAAPDEFFKYWSKFTDEYYPDLYNLKDAMIWLLASKFEGIALELGRRFAGKTKCDFFETVPLCHSIMTADFLKKPPLEIIKSMTIRHRYNYIPFLDAARAFGYVGDHESVDLCFEEALASLKRREKEKIYELRPLRENIYDSYKFVLKKMEDFYEAHKNKEALKRTRNLFADIQAREEQLAYLPEDDKLEQRLTRVDQKAMAHLEEQLQTDPAVKYHNFLKQFNINFATDNLTSSKITTYRHGKEPTTVLTNSSNPTGQLMVSKIGRNDPCPCGANKPNGRSIKYKRCCGA